MTDTSSRERLSEGASEAGSGRAGDVLSTIGFERQELIAALQRCVTATEHCASLATGLPHATTAIGACRDASCLCRVASELLARGSSFDGWAVSASLLAADVCASECGVHMGRFFQEAAGACRNVKLATNGCVFEPDAPPD